MTTPGQRRASAQAIWYRDLATIKRQRPLYKGRDKIVNLEIVNSSLKGGTVGGTIDLTSDNEDEEDGTIDLTSDNDDEEDGTIDLTSDNDDEEGGNSPRRGGHRPHPAVPDGLDTAAFYGVSGTPDQIRNALKYQLRGSNVGQYPSPTAGLRFDLTLLREDLNYPPMPTAQELEDRVRYQRFRSDDSVPHLFEECLHMPNNWVNDRRPGTSPLLRGFPMMEDVVFVRAANYRGTPANCYWKAVAAQVYGHPSYDDRVKAEHLDFYSEILATPTHPRHDQYSEVNRRFYQTYVGPGQQSVQTVANIYQLLRIPNSWTPGDMFDITADLYNLFIVVYSIRNRTDPAARQGERPMECYEVATKGSYNARHIFMMFVDDTHYQPMVPNEYFASEFRFPRITHNSTFGYPQTYEGNKKRPWNRHSWRTRGAALDITKGPPPPQRAVSSRTFRRVITGMDGS